MTTFEWGPLLKRWSEDWLDGLAAEEPEEFEELDEDLVRERWLGFAPASPERLTALEERVGALGITVPLPPSLRSFLETSDGWRHAGSSVYLLAGTEGITSYGDPYGLRPMYEKQLGADPAEEEVLRAGMWGRALQLALDSDMTDVLLDPGDVAADGEWAVYVRHGWSGEHPDRYASFRVFMEDMYKEFYRISGDRPGFETEVTRDLDARVEQARVACLRGDLDGALAVFKEAMDLGRPRAGLLAAQLTALLEGSGWIPVDPRMDDPLYAHEVLPLKISDHLGRHGRDDSFVLGPLTEEYATDRERAAIVLEEARRRTYEYVSPGPFGLAVTEARARARRGDTDGAWQVLAAAVPKWEPYGEDHLAPFGLLGDPLLGPVVTPERGRQLLLTPRAGQAGAAPAPAAGAPAVRDGLGWLSAGDPGSAVRRDSGRFVLVAGIEPEELAERFGTGAPGPVARGSELWDLLVPAPQGNQGAVVRFGGSGPLARIGAVDGWSFAFESSLRTGVDPARLVDPGAGLSHGTRALTVWWEPGLFHFACAEDGAERYGFTVHGQERRQWGDLPGALTPERLFPDLGGPAADRSDEARALTAIAEVFTVSLPRFALDHGRLPTLRTRSWT
ncbi:SMI1/KNR4 family protein [Streptomyces sp. NPDC002564]|uniref:SMI1/KNR4 family protein n=1 Tax=Streptomyces sp. NPDC002564 TaxID=3364649 RepID=UPI0036C80B30